MQFLIIGLLIVVLMFLALVLVLTGMAIVVMLQIKEEVMDAITQAVTDLETAEAAVLAKIDVLKQAGDPAALAALAARIATVTQALNQAIA